jgi:putative endonuclease
MFYVYILYSERCDRYYIGQTADLEVRLSRHNGKLEKSTSPYVPWIMVCFITKETRSDAMILETKLKNFNTKDLKRFIAKYQSQAK